MYQQQASEKDKEAILFTLAAKKKNLEKPNHVV